MKKQRFFGYRGSLSRLITLSIAFVSYCIGSLFVSVIVSTQIQDALRTFLEYVFSPRVRAYIEELFLADKLSPISLLAFIVFLFVWQFLTKFNSAKGTIVNQSTPDDIYDLYIIGASQLVTLLKHGDPAQYVHAVTLQGQLVDNLALFKRNGERDADKTELAKTVAKINDLALEFSISLNSQENNPTNVPDQSKPAYLSAVHQLILKHYDAEELRTLCFHLGIAYDDLRGAGREGKAREFILMLERHARMDELRQKVTKDRPNAIWPKS